MAIVTERRTIRADGPDKVTGSGRYTADLTLTGMLARQVPLRRRRARPHHPASTSRPRAGDARRDGGADRRRRARRALRAVRAGPHAVRPRRRSIRRRGHRRGRRATLPRSPRQAADAIVVEFEPLPVVTDLEAALADDAPLGARPTGQAYGAADVWCAIATIASFSSIAKGDVEAGMAEADHVITSRYVADGSHAAPIEPRAVVAQWEGNKVTIWTSTQVPFDARAGRVRDPGAARQPRPHHRAPPRRRLRRQVRIPLRGAHRRAGQGSEAARAVGVLAARGVRRARPPTRGHGDRHHHRGPQRRHDHRPAGVARDRQRRVHGRQRVLPPAGGDARRRAVPDPQPAVAAHLVYTNHQPSGSVRAPTAPQSCWALESHTDEVAAALGMDPVDFRRLNAVDTGVEGPSGQTYGEIGVQQCIEEATKLVGYGARTARRRGHRRRHRLVAELRGAVRRVHQDRRRRLGPDHHRRAGVRHRRGDDAAPARGRGTGHGARGLRADLPGHRRSRPYDMGATGSQTMFNNGRAVRRRGRPDRRTAAGLAAEHLEASPADIVLADGHAHVAGTPASTVSIAELAGSPSAASC